MNEDRLLWLRRKVAGYTLKRMAARLGVTKGAYSRAERGNQGADPSSVRMKARALLRERSIPELAQLLAGLRVMSQRAAFNTVTERMGFWLRVARYVLNVTLREVEKETGVAIATLSLWERGLLASAGPKSSIVKGVPSVTLEGTAWLSCMFTRAAAKLKHEGEEARRV